MKASNSIRQRLALTFFGLACVLVSVFSAGLLLAFDVAEDQLFDDHVRADVDAFMALYARDPGVVKTDRANFQVLVAVDGEERSLPPYLQGLAADADEAIIDGDEFELVIRRVGDQTLYFLFDESEFEEFELTLLSAMAVLMTLMIAGAAWVGVSLAERVIRPLTSLSRQVARLAGDPEGRVVLDSDAAPDDEIARLARAINGYHVRISELLQREHEFSSDVSHELRTPIMAIQGAAEILGQKAGLDTGAADLINRIKRGCLNMTTLTEALLYLARDPESFAAMVRPVSVRRVVEEQMAAVRDMANRKGVLLQINDAADAVIDTVPAVIDIVIGNVLKNAVKYTDQGVITIYLDKGEVIIQDYGPGVDRAAQPTLFERYDRGGACRSGVDGNGIGLALVKRFCEQYGWSLRFESSEHAGTRVALAF